MISLSFLALSDIIYHNFFILMFNGFFESVFLIACVSICVPRTNQNSQL